MTSPFGLRANGLYNPFTNKKKWQITCGKCEHSFSEKLIVNEICSAICPCCKTQNKWSYSLFMRIYKHGMPR